MPSTDVDGSKIVILTEAEARRVYEYLDGPSPRDPLEQRLADKIARDLNLPLLDWSERRHVLGTRHESL
jgi:hypothetical protein